MDITPHSFALDNIYITSRLNQRHFMLFFNCDFDNMTMCSLQNDAQMNSANNFTVFTGDTVPDRELGPLMDHTSNSSTGGFAYWNQSSPPTFGNYGRLILKKEILQNFGICIRFAYFVNSTAKYRKATKLSIYGSDCYSRELWTLSLDDSHEWQIVTVSLPKFACNVQFSFSVSQGESVPISVAFDDIEFVQCYPFLPTTTTTVITNTTSSVSSTTSVVTSTTTSLETSTRNFVKFSMKSRNIFANE
ncbi:hypothetical protein I4U23_026981 [Adineta vaga]|nr:hypothetical protein I4U23_026981 [Adineta vaga]